MFNNWSWDKGFVLKFGKKGYSVFFELEVGVIYEFCYFINGQDWYNDEIVDDYQGILFFSYNCVLVIDLVEIKFVVFKKVKVVFVKKVVVKKFVIVKVIKVLVIKVVKLVVKKVFVKKVFVKVVVKLDDLKKIEGIGFKIVGFLVVDGIVLFVDLVVVK